MYFPHVLPICFSLVIKILVIMTRSIDARLSHCVDLSPTFHKFFRLLTHAFCERFVFGDLEVGGRLCGRPP